MLISPLPDQEGKKLQRQKILIFIHPIYNHNWRNVSFIYIYLYIFNFYLFIYITRLASNEIFSTSNKIHREVGRTKDLSALLHIIAGGRQLATCFGRLCGHLEVMCKRKCVGYSQICSCGEWGLDSHMKLLMRNTEKVFKTEFSVPTLTYQWITCTFSLYKWSEDDRIGGRNM